MYMTRIHHQNVDSAVTTGPGKVFELPECLDARSYNVKSPFRENVIAVGSGKCSGPNEKQSKFFCTDENCLKLLESVEDFQEHLDFGVHDYSIIRPHRVG